MTPTVSFIVPVRNDAERLEVCLRSMRANVHAGAAIELIVVDNGSVDGSAEVARKAGAKVIRIEEAGVSHLRNVGAALGPVVALCKAEDLASRHDRVLDDPVQRAADHLFVPLGQVARGQPRLLAAQAPRRYEQRS